jgi:general secretion pathway protein I
MTAVLHAPRAREAGMTLLEVLVAFVILAVALTTVMQVFSTGLQGTRRAEAANIAAVIAESKLAMVGVEVPVRAGRLNGVEGNGFTWELEIAPYREAEGIGETQPPMDTLRVRVEVRWPGARGAAESFTLHTMRLAPAS